MVPRLRALLFYALYWIGFMVVIRGIFLIYNHELLRQLSPHDVLNVFLYGLKMDASMSGYLLMFTALMFIIRIYTDSPWVQRITTVVQVLFLILSSLVVIVDMELYHHWGFRLNTTPFFYIGKEALGTIGIGVLLKGISIFVPLIVVFLYLYLRRLARVWLPIKKSNWVTLSVMIPTMVVIFFFIRGSFSVAPMNTGFVYFHKTNAFANHAAINVVWNFLNSVWRGSEGTYEENFFDKKLARQYFNELYTPSDSTSHVLSTNRPNVIIIVMESFTADVIEPLGGMKGIAPNFNALTHEGILFTNFYGNGDRTDKGIVSVLSGYPAQPTTSIIKYPSKAQHLPYLTHTFNKLGYHTSFVYGGDVDFANFRSYLTNCRFEHITSYDDMPSEWYTSKWGIHDHYMFSQTTLECDSTKTPFFKVFLTLSSHEPFDVPMEPLLKGNDEEALFLNACHYTDKCLGDFITSAKKKPWWNNTLIILVADHGHRLPYNKELSAKERFRIPMLWLGGALTRRDTTITTYAAQTDIANTLLAQIDKPSDEFNFSRNILGFPVQSFAAYFYNNGYGFVRPHQSIVFDNTSQKFVRTDSTTAHDLDVSKAFQEVLFEDYNRR